MTLDSELERLEKYWPIEQELIKAKKKHPNWPVQNMYKQVTILQEEAGEVSKAVLHLHDEDGSKEHLRIELIQTAAMCMRMLETLDISTIRI